MSGIGFSELIILALIGLIVLGPERLPRVANQLGGWLGQARRMTRVMKRQLEDELNLEKDFTIKSPPVSREPSTRPEVQPAPPPRDDDDFSPAHAEDDVGTGVGEDANYDNDDDLAVKTADLSARVDQDPAATTADEADATKAS
jgi:sec-independent protein translocase protein TatB